MTDCQYAPLAGQEKGTTLVRRRVVQPPRRPRQCGCGRWVLLIRGVLWLVVVGCVVILQALGNGLQETLDILLTATVVAVMVDRRVIRSA